MGTAMIDRAQIRTIVHDWIKKGRLLRRFQHTRPVLAFLSDWSDQWNETLRDIWIMSRS